MSGRSQPGSKRERPNLRSCAIARKVQHFVPPPGSRTRGRISRTNEEAIAKDRIWPRLRPRRCKSVFGTDNRLPDSHELHSNFRRVPVGPVVRGRPIRVASFKDALPAPQNTSRRCDKRPRMRRDATRTDPGGLRATAALAVLPKVAALPTRLKDAMRLPSAVTALADRRQPLTRRALRAIAARTRVRARYGRG